MSDLTEAEWLVRALHGLTWKGEDVSAAVERIIATRLTAAEARAEAAERKVADAWDEGWIQGQRDHDPTTLGYADNPYRAALDTAADPDTPTPTRWERA